MEEDPIAQLVFGFGKLILIAGVAGFLYYIFREQFTKFKHRY